MSYPFKFSQILDKVPGKAVVGWLRGLAKEKNVRLAPEMIQALIALFYHCEYDDMFVHPTVIQDVHKKDFGGWCFENDDYHYHPACLVGKPNILSMFGRNEYVYQFRFGDLPVTPSGTIAAVITTEGDINYTDDIRSESHRCRMLMDFDAFNCDISYYGKDTKTWAPDISIKTDITPIIEWNPKYTPEEEKLIDNNNFEILIKIEKEKVWMGIYFMGKRMYSKDSYNGFGVKDKLLFMLYFEDIEPWLYWDGMY